jgi:hypothetical protein
MLKKMLKHPKLAYEELQALSFYLYFLRNVFVFKVNYSKNNASNYLLFVLYSIN